MLEKEIIKKIKYVPNKRKIENKTEIDASPSSTTEKLDLLFHFQISIVCKLFLNATMIKILFRSYSLIMIEHI